MKDKISIIAGGTGQFGVYLSQFLLKKGYKTIITTRNIKLAKKKCKFYEVPITYKGRSYEDGKKIGLKDAFIALKTIIFYSLK